MKTLDEKDWLLLNSLKKNARQPLAALARSIDLSRSATHDRLIKLESNGVIQGYSVILNESMEDKIQAIFLINFQTGYNNLVLAKRISRLSYVIATHCLSGDIDLLTFISCNDSSSLYKTREDIAKIDGVASINTHLIFKTVNEL